MKLFQAKILSTLFVLILTFSPNACLLEQAFAVVKEMLPCSHHYNQSGDHHSTAPSHRHDEEGSENVFCCDNTRNSYIVSKSFTQFNSLIHLTSSLPFEACLTESTISIEYDYILHRYRQPPPLRSRDKYALSCLLHAPPSC